jgi:hypothetical protein
MLVEALPTSTADTRRRIERDDTLTAAQLIQGKRTMKLLLMFAATTVSTLLVLPTVAQAAAF